jgi:predicted Zn-dependent protease with MMP-like domain
MVVPPSLPLSRTRSQQFDDRVLDAVEHLEQRWSKELDGVEFAVEEVPLVEPPGGLGGTSGSTYDDEVLEDGAVPLARLIPGHRENGQAYPPRIVLYRRPLEARAVDHLDLDDLVHDVVIEQVASLLGMHPDELDPPGGS